MSQGWVGDGPHQNYSRDLKKYLFNCWLHTVSIAALRLSLVAVSGGCSSLWCMGFSLQWLLLLWNTGCRMPGLQ